MQAQQSIYSQFDATVSSEPVPIKDMLSGWDGSYRSGEVVFADVSWAVGFKTDLKFADQHWGALALQREYRHYYYLNFDKETSDYYRTLELKQKLEGNKKLDLVIKQFEAPGISVAYQTPDFRFNDLRWQVGFKLALYQPGHFQFAKIKGIAEAGDATTASAIIDYSFDDDKILDFQADVDKGLGLSLSSELRLELEHWQLELELKDMVNQFQWDDGAITRGCINVGGGSKAQCVADGAGSGISKQEQVTESIPYTLNTRIQYSPADISLNAMTHDAYYRVGLEKGLQTSLGRFAFFLYYPRLVGLSWQASLFNIQLGADTLKFSQARNIQLNMGVNWHW